MPKRLRIPLVGVLLGLVLSGCSIQEDIVRLDLRLAEVARDQNDLAARLGAMEQRLAEANQSRDAQEGELRARYAETRAQIKGLDSDLARLRGRIEEVEYNLGRRLADADRSDARRGGHVERLEAELARGLQRLASIENYLNLEVPPPPSAVPSGDKPSAPAEAGDDAAGDGAPSGPSGPQVSAPSAPAAPEIAPAPPPDEESLYAAAKRDFDQGAFEAAREGFTRLLERFPRSKHADNAQFWIGETFYRERWYEKAILEYQKVIENHPQGNKVPASLLKQGLAFFNLGDAANARLVLKELIGKYPKSNEAQIARQKVKGGD